MISSPRFFLAFLGCLLIGNPFSVNDSNGWAQTIVSPGGNLSLLFIERYVSGAGIRYGPGTVYRNYGNGKAWGKARGGRGLPLRTMAETGIDVSSYSETGFDDAGMSAWTNTEFHIKPFFLKSPPSYLDSVPAKIYLNANVAIETLSTGNNANAEAEAVVAFGYKGDPEHPLFYRRYTQPGKVEIREVLDAWVKTSGSTGYVKSANSYASGVVSGFGLATASSSVVFDPVIEWDQEELDGLMGEDSFPLHEYVGMYISNGVNLDSCWLDIHPDGGDGDVDGADLALYASGLNVDALEVGEDFGRHDCPRLVNNYWATYYDDAGGMEQGPYYMNLIQDGDLLVDSWICDDLGIITGTLQGNDISLSWDEEGETITIAGQVDGDTMAGISGPYSWRAEKVDEPQCEP